MSFEDELKELISGIQSDRERQNRELAAFRDSWQQTKLTTVKPTLDQGAQALKLYGQVVAAAELRNGSIRLSVGRASRDIFTEINALVFSPNADKREIECSYKGSDIESFTLDNLDVSTVQRKVKEFISAVLGHDLR
jgi:hypothetical protein